MRRTLIIVIMVLLLILFGYMLYSNTTIGGTTIYGIAGLNEKNENLETKIQTASRMTTSDYQNALTELQDSAKEFTTAKQSYEEMVEISSEDEAKAASQLEKYEIEYLWTRIGNHATDRGVQLKLELSANTTSEATGYYDLKFTTLGTYVGTTDFIYDIENDSSLGFKIESFKMQPGSGENTLQSTFTCKDIAINIDASNLTTNSTNTTEETDKTNTTTDDTNTTSNAGTDAANAAQNAINDNFSIQQGE